MNIGNAKVTQESSSKQLVIQIEENQNWNEQVDGTGGVIKSLNKRLYIIHHHKKEPSHFPHFMGTLDQGKPLTYRNANNKQ